MINNLTNSNIYATTLDLTTWLKYSAMGFYFQTPSYYRQFSDPEAFKLISKLFIQKKITLAQYELLLNNLKILSTYLGNNSSVLGNNSSVPNICYDDTLTLMPTMHTTGYITYII